VYESKDSEKPHPAFEVKWEDELEIKVDKELSKRENHFNLYIKITY